MNKNILIFIMFLVSSCSITKNSKKETKSNNNEVEIVETKSNPNNIELNKNNAMPKNSIAGDIYNDYIF